MDYCLVFKTKWVPENVPGPYSETVQTPLDFSWIVYDSEGREIRVRQFPDPDRRTLDVLESDVLEFSPVIVGFQIRNFDFSALFRVYPGHSLYDRLDLIYDVSTDLVQKKLGYYSGATLNNLLNKYFNRSRSENNLQEVRDIWELANFLVSRDS